MRHDSPNKLLHAKETSSVSIYLRGKLQANRTEMQGGYCTPQAGFGLASDRVVSESNDMQEQVHGT